MATEADAPTPLVSLPGNLLVEGWHNVLAIAWQKPAHMASIERLRAVRSKHLARHPGGTSVIHVLLASANPPDAEARASLVDMMRNNSQGVAAIAVVTLGDGFDVSAVRSRVTGMRLEAPGAFRLRFHANVNEVLNWLPEQHEKRTGVRLDRVTLLQWLQRLAQSVEDPTAEAGTRRAP